MNQTERITIALPTEMTTLIKDAVDSGDYASVSEVVREAIRNWKLKRLAELQEFEQISRSINQGLEDIKLGKITPADEVFNRLENKYSKKS